MKKMFVRMSENPRFLLGCAVAVGIVLLLLQALFSVDMFRDSAAVYSPQARALAAGDLNGAFHPGIPCLNVLLSAPLSWLGIAPETALGIVSSAFYAASIPLLYLLLAEFLPPGGAAFGSLCFACAPKIIRFSCSGIIDSGKGFFLIGAMLLLTRFIRGGYRSWKTALLFGLMLGGLSLARSEGIGNAVVFCGALALYWIADSYRDKKIRPLWPACTGFFPWIACIWLRIWINGRFCGAAIFDERIADGLGRLCAVLTRTPATAATTVSASSAPRVSWGDLLNQNIRGGYELYWIFAAAGVLLVLFSACGKMRRVWPDAEIPSFVKWDRLYWLLLLVPLANALIFKASDIAAYRYFLPNIPCMMLFTVTGFYFAGKWITRFLPGWVPGIACAILFFCQIVNGASNIFSAESRIQYAAGRELGKMLAAEKETAKVWFTTASAEWYYSGLKRAVPIECPQPDPAHFDDFDYALWHEGQDGIETLRKRRDLQEIPLTAAGKVRFFRRVK